MFVVSFNYYGSTDKGEVKEINEDAFNGIIHNDVLFLMVADGLGGKEGISPASVIAVNEMRRYIERNHKSDDPEYLKDFIENGFFWINRVLLAHKRANDTLYGGFGTAFTVCAINKNRNIVVGHAGNTRLYMLREGNLAQLTTDHTEAQKLFEAGKIKREELRDHPERAILTKALGHWEEIDFDIFGGRLLKEDIVLLCSDGVHALLTDDEIQAILLESGESKTACEWLIQGANRRGGIDNSVALISYINF